MNRTSMGNTTSNRLPFTVGLGGKLKASMSKKKTTESLQMPITLELWSVENKPILVDLNRIRTTKFKQDVLIRVSMISFFQFDNIH